MEKIQSLNPEDFEEKVINSRMQVVLHFSAPWCHVSKTTDSLIKELSTQYRDIAFYSIDIDESEGLATQNGIKGIPAVVVYKDGEEHATLTGTHEIEQLNNVLSGIKLKPL